MMVWLAIGVGLVLALLVLWALCRDAEIAWKPEDFEPGPIEEKRESEKPPRVLLPWVEEGGVPFITAAPLTAFPSGGAAHRLLRQIYDGEDCK